MKEVFEFDGTAGGEKRGLFCEYEVVEVGREWEVFLMSCRLCVNVLNSARHWILFLYCCKMCC